MLTSSKKSVLRDRIKQLEEENAQIQHQFDSDNSMLISKEDHKTFVDSLHKFHQESLHDQQKLLTELQGQVDEQTQANSYLEASLKTQGI